MVTFAVANLQGTSVKIAFCEEYFRTKKTLNWKPHVTFADWKASSRTGNARPDWIHICFLLSDNASDKRHFGTDNIARQSDFGEERFTIIYKPTLKRKERNSLQN